MSHSQYQQSYRRRPIVVRDPKTGATRLVGGGGSVKDSTASRRPASVPTPTPTQQRGTYSGGFRPSYQPESFDRTNSSSHVENTLGFDDEGRAPIMKIVSGYRGRQIVVRDPSRRPSNPQQAPLGVRAGGVRKANYYDRRGTRSSPYSEGYEEIEEQARQEYYEPEDEEEETRFYGRDRAHEYSRNIDHHRMEAEYPTRYPEQREYSYRGGRNESLHDDDDLTGRVVYVDNLSDDVTTTGLANLFGMVGAVKELRLLYDRDGNPNGSADIVFQRRRDAEEAIKNLDNVPLNNRPMKLSMGNGL